MARTAEILHFCAPYNGEILGRLDLGGPVLVAPVAAGGMVYILTEDAQLLAYR